MSEKEPTEVQTKMRVTADKKLDEEIKEELKNKDKSIASVLPKSQKDKSERSEGIEE